MATCHLCPPDDNQIDDNDIQAMDDHLRILHPEVYGDGPERWADGAPVVYDMTLEPADFAKEA